MGEIPGVDEMRNEKTDEKTSVQGDDLGEYETYEINRDGMAPLKFQGQEMASVSSYEHNGPTNNRWDEYSIYCTKGGKYIIAHDYYTRWQGESARHEAWVAETGREAIEKASAWAGDYDIGNEVEIPNLLVELAHDAGIDIAEIIE